MGRGGRASQGIERTQNPFSAPVEDACIDHRRPHVVVSEQLLDGADVVPGLQKTGRETVPQAVRRAGFVDPGAARSWETCSI
jgi:hypothetical protein